MSSGNLVSIPSNGIEPDVVPKACLETLVRSTFELVDTWVDTPVDTRWTLWSAILCGGMRQSATSSGTALSNDRALAIRGGSM